ncbi:hypothetical protein QLL95_gp0453 [Cotonvirus japonicus]|uniref:Uncharacterized protein n=1 Tax=Cotonvirus japonicus TaxID=2811091 RepID=A0ABN6EDF9_9VIRU|nr:hypothetical protein QLL95_gp0453 [Cotonvirus japonicus]BCS83670.1 hypothetical protein [Cotonvirus japonicus]
MNINNTELDQTVGSLDKSTIEFIIRLKNTLSYIKKLVIRAFIMYLTYLFFVFFIPLVIVFTINKDDYSRSGGTFALELQLIFVRQHCAKIFTGSFHIIFVVLMFVDLVKFLINYYRNFKKE